MFTSASLTFSSMTSTFYKEFHNPSLSTDDIHTALYVKKCIDALCNGYKHTQSNTRKTIRMCFLLSGLETCFTSFCSRPEFAVSITRVVVLTDYYTH